MKKSALYLFFFAILFSTSSCGTDPLLRTYISGEWRPVKFASIDMNKMIPSGDTAVPQYNQEDYKMLTELKQSLSTTNNPDGSGRKSTGEDFTRMITEANTTYIFRREGFGGRLNPETPIKGSWKLKNKGKRLILTDDRTKEQFVINIDSLTSKRMVATNKNLPNGMKVTYVKVTDEAP